jgi:hypothetical protein
MHEVLHSVSRDTFEATIALELLCHGNIDALVRILSARTQVTVN